jgi:6-phosphogluconolactonase (cycloisomerase 2 family)
VPNPIWLPRSRTSWLSHETFGPDPAFEICGPRAGLAFSDGVAFVPPGDEYLAACNLTLGSVTFYRRVSVNPVVFEVTPEFELKHESLHHPDGLGFSRCGSWLAVANHGNHSVSIFRRRRSILSSGKIKYGPQPVMVLKDPAFRHPHSVAFTPLTDHLVVTNAGANFFSAYQPGSGYFGTRWAQSPCCKKAVASNADFRRTNDANAMEGGPKGIAVHQNQMAVCSPEIGIKIFSFRERPQNSRKASAPN